MVSVSAVAQVIPKSWVSVKLPTTWTVFGMHIPLWSHRRPSALVEVSEAQLWFTPKIHTWVSWLHGTARGSGHLTLTCVPGMVWWAFITGLMQHHWAKMLLMKFPSSNFNWWNLQMCLYIYVYISIYFLKWKQWSVFWLCICLKT